MKRILLLLTLIAGIDYTFATNTLTVSPTTIPLGLTGTIDIELNNDVSFTAFTLKLSLPEGLSFVLDENEKPTFDRGTRFSDHALSVGPVVNNSATFACLSASSATIAGTNGTLLSVYVKSKEDMVIGTELTATLSESTFTTPDEKEENIADENIIITIGEPRIIFNENSGTIPSYSGGEKGNVRMIRNITGGNWSTIVLPFTLTKSKAEIAFGSDVQLAEFTGFEVDYGDDEENLTPLGITVNFTSYTMNAKKGITGGKPFLIKTTKNITSFDADECSLVSAVSDVIKTDEYDTSGKFTGSFVATRVPSDGLFISGNKLWYSVGQTDIKAFRGWFELNAVLNKETDFNVKMFIDIDGIETKVDGVSTSNATTPNFYDLSGRKLGSKPKRGIYILDGKKVLVQQ